MIDASPDGEHMSSATFAKTLKFIQKYKLMLVMISGGEPLEHPEFFRIAEMAQESGLICVLLSNGMFLEDESLRQKVIDLNIGVQITNDPRYYPIKITKYEHPNIAYEDNLRLLAPFGRAKGMKTTRLSPLCFNLRSCMHSYPYDFTKAVMALRANGKMCSPSVNVDGSIVAGESMECHKIGTVESEENELIENLLNMHCNKCGLENNLSPKHKAVLKNV
jgi:hypothetical protein